MEGVAYLVRGNADQLPILLARLKKEGVAPEGNPDCYVRTYASFGMDDATGIRARAALRGVSGPRVFVIAAPLFTTEAQNALLKTFEEPSAGASFYLLTPAPDSLLPTLRSRMQRLTLQGVETPDSGVDPRAFLSAPPALRLEMLKPLLPKKKDEEGEEAGRDVGGALAFLEGIERLLLAARAAETDEGKRGVRAVLSARMYMADKGSLLKTLLEQVALLAPRV